MIMCVLACILLCMYEDLCDNTGGLWGSVFFSVGSDKHFVYLTSGGPYLVGLSQPK